MKTTFLSFILFLTFIFINSPLQAQGKRLEFNLGFGPVLDVVHAGLNFKIIHEVDVGFSLGTIPNKLDFNDHINIGFEGKYKFGDSPIFKTRIERDGRLKNIRLKTWYCGLRANFVKNIKTVDTEKKFIYITPSIGRHCNFNESIGMNIDFGLSMTARQSTLYTGNTICSSCFLEENPQFPLLPTLRIQFFVKI